MQIRRRRLFAIWSVLVPALLTAPPLAADDAQPAKPANPADAAAKPRSSGEWHWPKVVISKKTTYFTEPLRPDGGVDYVAAFNRRYSQGVTPENNAAVAFWQAIGPATLEPKDRKRFFQMLGIPDLPEKGGYLVEFSDLPASRGLKKGSDEEAAARWEMGRQWDAACITPWSKDKYPVWAQDLERDEKPLEILTDGLQKPHFYSPLVDGFGNGITRKGFRQAARVLQLRSMLRLGDGDVSGAWCDIIALHRLSRWESRQPALSAWLAAEPFEKMASMAGASVSQHRDITAAQAREFQRQLRALPPFRRARDVCNEGGRCSQIEWLMSLSEVEEGRQFFDFLASVREHLPGGVPDPGLKRRRSAFERLVGDKSVDWTDVLRRHNQWCDRVVAAFDCPTSLTALDKLEALAAKSRKSAQQAAELALAARPAEVAHWGPRFKAQRIAELVALASGVDAWTWLPVSEQKIQAYEDLTLVAFALAGYRADHDGTYPTALAQLVPAYIDAIPKDPFTDGDLHYKSDGEGYLLYSVGPNGKDDGGLGPESFAKSTTEEQRKTCDDISIRTPPRKSEANEK